MDDAGEEVKGETPPSGQLQDPTVTLMLTANCSMKSSSREVDDPPAASSSLFKTLHRLISTSRGGREDPETKRLGGLHVSNLKLDTS